ncbi:MAG: 6-carboxytetrahydropterin synthase QueD [Chlamydiae bacterium]|nr:6-carboxytetrahydropterin synthase QueD [Chlamydiota bacterium]
MFEIEKHFKFHAAHQLLHHDGVCHRLHGHTYILIIRLKSELLHTSGSSTNMVIDFAILKDQVQSFIDQYLDHHFLNETLETDSPTAEFIAEWIYKKLKTSILRLSSVTVFETASSSVTYSE